MHRARGHKRKFRRVLAFSASLIGVLQTPQQQHQTFSLISYMKTQRVSQILPALNIFQCLVSAFISDY